ncbi:hypothetical protein KLP28_09345 [Nocardioidaceae bacterium]|nr:hypothetical protein KLP28_09345 [Nocardioidaceae bacterium]
MRRGRVLLPVLIVLVVVGAVVSVLVPRGAGSSLEQAVERLPEDVLRVSYVDWQSVRAASADPGIDASEREIARFVRRVDELDAAPLTALGDEIDLYQRTFGVSVLSARWEALGQSREGDVDLLAVDDSVDLAEVERRLAALGYSEPSGGPGSGGLWIGGSDLVAGLEDGLTPIVQVVAVLPEERLVAFSTSDVYLQQTLEVIAGETPSLASVEHVEQLVAAAGAPTAGALLAQDYVCEALSMTTAAPDDQVALDAVDDGATPMEGYWFGRTGRDLTIAMAFDSASQAEGNLQVRAELASGPAYGQGGRLADRFDLTAARAEDELVVLDAQVRPRTNLMTAFVEGPVGFATCG